MKERIWIVWTVAISVVLGSGSAHANGLFRRNTFLSVIDGYQEIPTLSTTGRGLLVLHVASDESSIGYSLHYEALEGNVLQAHIHLGRPAFNGGVMVFLCSNLGNGPAGTPTCPGTNEGSVSGMLDASAVVAGAAGQGVAAGELDEVIAALRSSATYVNVHTTAYPGGEIRGNIR
jgi:hypothetical protein